MSSKWILCTIFAQEKGVNWLHWSTYYRKVRSKLNSWFKLLLISAREKIKLIKLKNKTYMDLLHPLTLKNRWMKGFNASMYSSGIRSKLTALINFYREIITNQIHDLFYFFCLISLNYLCFHSGMDKVTYVEGVNFKTQHLVRIYY